MKTPHLSRSIAIGAAIPLMISFMGVSAVAAEPTAADSASESSAAAEAASPDAASKPSSAGTTLVAGAAEMAPAISSATSTAIQVGIEGVPAAAPAVTAEVDYTKVHHDEGPNAYWSRTGYAAFQFTNWLPNYIFTVSIDNYATKVKVPVDATGYAEIQLPWEGDFHVYYTFPGISAGTTGWGWDMTSPELAASATTGSTATLAATDPVPTQGLWRYSSGPWSLSLTNGCDLVAAGHGAGADCTWTDLANAAALKTPYTFDLADLDESVAYALRLEDGAGMDTFAAAQKLSGTAGETLTSTELTNMVAGSGAVFSLADGSVLPDGLALDTATGEISGTPTAAAETSTVAINATLSGGSAQLAGLINLTIAPARPC